MVKLILKGSLVAIPVSAVGHYYTSRNQQIYNHNFFHSLPMDVRKYIQADYELNYYHDVPNMKHFYNMPEYSDFRRLKDKFYKAQD